METNSKKAYLGNIKSIVSSEVRDYSNDPFILKKNAAARAFFEKNGVPTELIKRYAERESKEQL